MKIQNVFQKFHRMVDGHVITDFWMQKNFWFWPFFDLFSNTWIKKKPRAKKTFNIKNQFFHARQPRVGILDVCSHLSCIFTISCQSFQWLPLYQFWELTSKNEICRTISCIYFMKICVNSWFSTTEPSLIGMLQILVNIGGNCTLCIICKSGRRHNVQPDICHDFSQKSLTIFRPNKYLWQKRTVT